MPIMSQVEINGVPATVDQLHKAATVNYGHFTSMQVRGGAVRGLGPHLERLDAASRELFGVGLDGARVRELIRHALAGTTDASVRVTVREGTGGARDRPAAGTLDVMVSVTDPIAETADPAWRVRTVRYQRELPHLKHLATMGLVRHWRLAQADGFDDALFLDGDDRVSEGSAWNLALWDGERIVWPDADQLDGIAMRLLRDALPRVGVRSVRRAVHRADLDAYPGAVATWSISPAQPLAAIDERTFADTAEAVRVLRAAWETIPWDPM